MDREEFIREFHIDPYTHMVAYMRAQAWAAGYAAACHEHTSEQNQPLYLELVQRSLDELLKADKEAEMQAVLAMAALGRQTPPGI